MSIAGRYRHIIKLGEGTYGAVYQATERDTGRIIAFKRMMSSSDDEGVPGTAIREICFLKELKHDNIVSMYEVLFEQPKITLIFELCDCDLKKFLEDQVDGRMDPLTEIRPALRQMFLGLQYLHSHGVVHRDLKPQNIFLNVKPRPGATSQRNEKEKDKDKEKEKEKEKEREGGEATRAGCLRVERDGKPSTAISHEGWGGGAVHHLSIKLGDFGLARVDNIPVKKYSHEVVTLWYRSPDAMMGSALYSYPVDIWSMGAIFFEIVTGKVLFCGQSEEEQLFRMFFLLGSPTHESWSSMLTYPKMRSRLESVMEFATQFYHTVKADDTKSSGNSHVYPLHNRGRSKDIFPDFFKRHLVESKADVRLHDSTPAGDHSRNSTLFSRSRVNSYQLPAELWFPNPMLDAFLIETGFRDAVGDDGIELLRRTLEYEPSRRITCDHILQHPFLMSAHFPSAGILEQLERDLEHSLQAAGL